MVPPLISDIYVFFERSLRDIGFRYIGRKTHSLVWMEVHIKVHLKHLHAG